MYLGLYQAMHYGPDAHAPEREEGLFAAPARGGAADGTTVWRNGFGTSVDMPYDEYAWLGSDRAHLVGPKAPSPPCRARAP